VNQTGKGSWFCYGKRQKRQIAMEFNTKQQLGFRLFCGWGILLAKPVKKRNDKWFEQTMNNNYLVKMERKRITDTCRISFGGWNDMATNK
jgi:hypothetical protein